MRFPVFHHENQRILFSARTSRGDATDELSGIYAQTPCEVRAVRSCRKLLHVDGYLERGLRAR